MEENGIIDVYYSSQGSSNIKSQKKKKIQRLIWSEQENGHYIEFLIRNIDIAKSAFLRKKNKIFAKLAAIIRTRTSMQVKSHHQKLLIKYKSLENIIACNGKKKTKGSHPKIMVDAETYTDLVFEEVEEQGRLMKHLSFLQPKVMPREEAKYIEYNAIISDQDLYNDQSFYQYEFPRLDAPFLDYDFESNLI